MKSNRTPLCFLRGDILIPSLMLTFVSISASAQTAQADTHVYLTNSTGSTIQLEYQQDGPISKGGYETGPKTLASGKRTLVMRYSRGASLTAKKNYNFTTTAYLSGDKKQAVRLLQTMTCSYIALGPLKKSSISAALQTPGQQKVTYYSDKNATKTFSGSHKVGNATYAVSFNWSSSPNGSGYHDLYYTISKTGTLTDSSELALVQYNIQQRPSSEGLQYQTTGTHSERSLLSTNGIPQVLNSQNADVVIFNEAFTAALRPELVKNMRKYGFLHHTTVLNSRTSSAWSGGVMIFSKHSILKTVDLEFKAYAGADKNAGKGVQYCVIQKGGFKYHIFATHTNASYDLKNGRVPLSDEGRKARASQFIEMKRFVDQQRIPQAEPVFITGDMNVDMLSEQGKPGDEYAYMLKTLNATHPARPQTSLKYSLEGGVNEWAPASDGKQFLDYTLYSNAHKQPKSSLNKVFRPRLNYNGKSRDLSDHYPLYSKFTF